MKTVTQAQVRIVPLSRGNLFSEPLEGALRVCQIAWDFIGEARAAIAGVFAIPLRQFAHGEGLERLDDCILRDMGYERPKGRQ